MKILRAIRPKEKAHRLVSPGVDAALATYARNEQTLWTRFLASRAGSLAEERLARKLSKIYLLKAAQKLASPEAYLRSLERDKWARRFTEASIKLYGAPQLNYVEKIVRDQAAIFASGQGAYIEEVAYFYTLLIRRLDALDIAPAAPLRKLDEADIATLKQAFYERHADWFDYLERQPKTSYSPGDLTALFGALLKLRAARDRRWRDWRVRLVSDKDIVSVTSTARLVSVGEERVAASYADTKGLVAHELGIHAERAVNGRDIGGGLERGWPGYLGAEESLGILAERLVSGRLPDKAQDRYVDIALAMGLVPDVQLSRLELLELATNRALARRVLAGEEITANVIDYEAKRAKTHVHRIFRGGDGLKGDFQAVFTKDSVYYPAVIEDYLARELASGKSAATVLGFLSQGKFDPTNERHLERLAKIKAVKTTTHQQKTT